MKRVRIGWATDRSRALPIIIAHAPLFRLYTLKARVRNNRRLSRGSPRLTFSTGIFHSVIIVGDNSSLAQSVCGFTWNVSIRIIAAKRISCIPTCRTHPWPRVLISCKFPAPIKFESTLCSLGMKMNFPRVFNKRDSICSLFIERTVSCSDEIIYDAIEKRSIERNQFVSRKNRLRPALSINSIASTRATVLCRFCIRDYSETLNMYRVVQWWRKDRSEEWINHNQHVGIIRSACSKENTRVDNCNGIPTSLFL